MGRLHEFDALRGIAAWAVVFSHLLNYRPAGGADPYAHWSAPLWSWTANGHFAVLIFFAISGFVLAVPYAAGAKDARNLSLDVANRIPRLLLPVLVTGALCFALQKLAQGWADPSAFAAPGWVGRWDVTGWDMQRAVGMLLGSTFWGYSEAETFNVNLWTMPVELAFSFVVFAVAAAWLGRGFMAAGLALGGVLLVVSWRAEPVEYVLKLIAASAFFLGLLTAARLEVARAALARSPLPWAMMAAGLALSVVLVRHGIDWKLANLLGLAAICLTFLGFVGAVRLAVTLDRPFWRLVGEASFALYLIHGSILYAVFSWLARDGYGWGEFAVGALISLVFSALASVAVARWIELPLVRGVRSALKRLTHRHAPA